MRRQQLITLMLVTFFLTALGTAVEAQTEETEKAPATTTSLKIEQSKLGLEIIDRELTEETSEFHVNDQVYLWMRVVGGPSDPITVTWHWGDLEFPVELKVGSSAWRTWSRKTVFKPGEWTVTVTDAGGTELASHTLTVSDEKRSEGSAER